MSDSVSPESQLYHIAYELGEYFQTRHVQRKHRAIEGDGSTFSRAFASTFLMPTTAIRDLIDLLHIENDNWSSTLLYEVACRFSVSTKALIWRLDSIHRIDKKLFEQFLSHPPKDPYKPSAPLPHNAWLRTLQVESTATSNKAPRHAPLGDLNCLEYRAEGPVSWPSPFSTCAFFTSLSHLAIADYDSRFEAALEPLDLNLLTPFRSHLSSWHPPPWRTSKSNQ